MSTAKYVRSAASRAKSNIVFEGEPGYENCGLTVRIRKCCDTGEFIVPTGPKGTMGEGDKYAYFTDDKQDAIDTAKFTFGPYIKWTITLRRAA